MPTVDGSFRQAHASPSDLRVRQEPDVATGDAAAVSAVGVAGVGAGAVVLEGGVAGVGAGVVGVVCGAGMVVAGGETGGVAGEGVCANAMVAAVERATATAIPINLFMRHLDG